ncbi:hypothetical protein NDA10_002305 [Ustilago hordei]|nr:hypothetical protein NDA10_002305 [Ustilago hordei]
MTDSMLHSKIDWLIELLERQQEDNAALRQYLCSLTHRALEPANESFVGGLETPTPSNRPPPQPITYDILGKWAYTDQEKYTTPTGPRYAKPAIPDAWGSTTSEPQAMVHMGLKTLFPKLDTRDVDIFFLEADAWFKANGVHDHMSMIHHTATQLEGTAREWWKARCHLEDPKFVVNLFWGSLTCSLQEKFEHNPPEDQWAWYCKVEDIDRQHMQHHQNIARFALTPTSRVTYTELGAPPKAGLRPLPPHFAQRPLAREPQLRPHDEHRVDMGLTTFNSDACRVCGKTGHWQWNCPNAKPTVYPPRPVGLQL